MVAYLLLYISYTEHTTYYAVRNISYNQPNRRTIGRRSVNNKMTEADMEEPCEEQEKENEQNMWRSAKGMDICQCHRNANCSKGTAKVNTD